MIKNYTIFSNAKIKEAINILNEIDRKCLVVINKNNQVIGTLTDGDIRRGLITGKKLLSKVVEVCNKNFLHYDENFSYKEIKNKLNNKISNIHLIPIIKKKNNKLIKIFNADNFKKNLNKYKKKKIKVFIMAGGTGKRLKPVSQILPKPLIPIGEKTLIESIIQKFFQQGFKNFLISIFYKKELIKSYFKDIKVDYKIKFLEEKKALGTAGSLAFLKNIRGSDFIITNCDNLININFDYLIDYHKKRKSDFTIVVNNKNMKLSYGEVEVDEKGNFIKINEKPKFKFLVNSGLYVINKRVLKYLKKNHPLNMNELISRLKFKNANIAVYPITDNSWADFGQWSQYRKYIKLLQH